MNRQRLANQMVQYGLDVLIASTPENVGYLTGFWTITQQIEAGVQTYALFTHSSKRTALIASVGDIMSNIRLIQPKQLLIVPYSIFYVNEGKILSETDQHIKEILNTKKRNSAVDALIEVIKEEGLSSAVIGVENQIPYQSLYRLKKEFPKIRIKEATDLFHTVRMVKTGREIECLRKSAEIIEKGIRLTLPELTEGISETEAAIKLKSHIIHEGAKPALMVIGFGANSAYSDADPCDNTLKRGDIVRFDVGCIWQHYYSDTAKIVVFGKEATDKQKTHYDALIEGHREGIANARAGVRVSDIFDTMMTRIRKGIPHFNRHHCGHGIGLKLHEPPAIAQNDNTILEEGMVINIEAPYYELGFGGLQTEDTILITENGNELLTIVDETLEECRGEN